LEPLLSGRFDDGKPLEDRPHVSHNDAIISAKRVCRDIDLKPDKGRMRMEFVNPADCDGRDQSFFRHYVAVFDLARVLDC
jgi:hypothetical protein